MCRVLTYAIGALGVAALMASSAASAKIMVATWTGTVSSGSDVTGVFGPANSSLNGDTFTVKFTYDTDLGTRLTSPGVSDEVEGGSLYGVPSPLMATLTINGIPKTIAGIYQAALGQDDTTYVEDIAYDVYVTNNTQFLNFVDLRAYVPGVPLNIEDSFAPIAVNSYSGHFQLYSYNGNSTFYQASGALTNDTYEIQPLAVPEPAAWVLMLTGLSLGGAMLRRRAVDAPAA